MFGKLRLPIICAIIDKNDKLYNKKNMENKNEMNLFSTRDLYLAATLISLRFLCIGIDYQIEGSKNRPVGFFKFENSDTLMDAKNKYNQGLLSVEPRSFVTNLNSLKAEVIGAMQNPHSPAV
jgi:hypothetical protein